MAFVKGTPKPAGSGRKKGQICRLAADVRTKLQEMGCDPIEGLARIGMAAEADGELAVASHCFGRLSKFCYPELRAVEARLVDDQGKDRNLTVEFLDVIVNESDSAA